MEQLLGMLGGAILGGQQDKRNYDQANRIGRLNNILGMEMGNYNFQKQLEMWEKTGPQGQMEQLKKAGLNPALMYGKSGPGGMLAAPATAGHTSANTGNYTEEMGMGMQLQTGIMQAQKALLEAQTKKAEAEAAKTAGVDTEAQTISNKIQSGSADELIKQARLVNEKLWQDAYSEAVDTNIAQGLFPEQKKLLAAQVVNTAQQTSESKSRIQVNNQDITNMREQVKVMRQEVQESIQRIAQSQTTQTMMYEQMKNLFTERNLTYEQTRQTEAATNNLLKTGDLLQYEKDLQDEGLRNPIVQSILGIVQEAAQGYGQGRGIGGGLRRTFNPSKPIGFQMNKK